MTIYPLFADQAFGPDKLHNMSRAYEEVCQELGLKPIDDLVTRQVAERIIACAQRGIADARTLTEMALRTFAPNRQDCAASR